MIEEGRIKHYSHNTSGRIRYLENTNLLLLSLIRTEWAQYKKNEQALVLTSTKLHQTKDFSTEM